MNTFSKAVSLLPIALGSELLILPDEVKNQVEEIRLRSCQPMSIVVNGNEECIASTHKIHKNDLQSVLDRATNFSVHSYESSFSRGYIGVCGGIRLGVCGTGIIKNDKVCGFRNLSSLSLRIPHECIGCAAPITEHLNGTPENILIISPPGCGKTTCMRDLIRLLSDSGYRVSVVDERGELAAAENGEVRFDLGCHTDVISFVPKSVGTMMMIRAMNPRILAVDEISSVEDVDAIEAVSGCGVNLIATAHAECFEDLYLRPVYRKLMDLKIFKYAVLISIISGNRCYRVKEL